MELKAKGEEMAQLTGLTFNTSMIARDETQVYLGYAELESGLWAVSSKGQEIFMAPIDVPPQIERGKKAVFRILESGNYEPQEYGRDAQRAQDRADDTERER